MNFMNVMIEKTAAGVALESEATFLLTPEEEAQLRLCIEDADRGETFSAEDVLAGLSGPRC